MGGWVSTNPWGSNPRWGDLYRVMAAVWAQWEGGAYNSVIFFFPLRAKSTKENPFMLPAGGETSTAMKYARVACSQEEITAAFYTLFWNMGAEKTLNPF